MLDALKNYRLSLLGNPEFRQKAQKIPIIQRLANNSAERLFALCSGFVQSQVLLAFVESGLPELLWRRSRSLSELAAKVGIPDRSMASLLQAAAALDLCEQLATGRYRLGDLGAVLIENPGRDRND